MDKREVGNVREGLRVVDMHCDTVSRILAERRQGRACGLRSNDLHVDLERMAQGGYLLQNFALFVNTRKCDSPWEEVCNLHEVYREELEANRDVLAPVLAYEDIERNRAQGKLSAMLTVEEGAVCQGETDKLERLYEMGVRMLTLTWNYPNELGFPNVRPGRHFEPDSEHGLTETGIEFVHRMEELGMIVDVSHLSDAGFYDVLKHSKKPFVASHSNAREVCGFVRNMTDGMIRKLADRGGCMGLNFCADFLETVPEGAKNPGTVAAVVRHAKHIVNVGGIEVLGLGTDFDGIDTHRELPGVQSMGRLWDALHDGGFKESEVEKIFTGNVLRVYREIL